MKSREYFSKKLGTLRDELRAEILQLFSIKSGQIWINEIEENAIEFENIETWERKDSVIDSIYISKNDLLIIPENQELCEINLSDIMNVHSLFCIHSIAQEECSMFLN